MCYLRFRYRTFNPDGMVASSQIRFYRFSSSLTNEAAGAVLLALSPAQQLAQSVTDVPTETGFHPVIRRSDITISDLGNA